MAASNLREGFNGPVIARIGSRRMRSRVYSSRTYHMQESTRMREPKETVAGSISSESNPAFFSKIIRSAWCWSGLLTCCSKAFSSLMRFCCRKRCFMPSTSLFNCSISAVFEYCNLQPSRLRLRMEITRASELRIVFLLGLSRDRLNPCSRSACEMFRFSREMFRKDLASSFTRSLLISFCFIVIALLFSTGITDIITKIGRIGGRWSLRLSCVCELSTREFTSSHAYPRPADAICGAIERGVNGNDLEEPSIAVEFSINVGRTSLEIPSLPQRR